MIKERMSKQDLMDLYGVDRVTIEDCRRNKGLKMIGSILSLKIHY